MKSICVCILVMAAARSFGGETRSVVLVNAPSGASRLTGNLLVDLFGDTTGTEGPRVQDQAAGNDLVATKSPWLAAGLSLALPGAGEFYSESFWKSAAFFAVEVAAWVFAYSYDKKGNRQTDFFQNYANTHWSVVRYAQFALQKLAPSQGYQIFIPGTENLPPWRQVNWSEINRMEQDIAANTNDVGSYYSHQLPPYGSQQYFELIGKYEQFSQGWDDADPSLNPDYQTIKSHLSPEFMYYSGERGKANTYYNHASTAIAVAVVNHILSAVDAAWSAGLYNRRVRGEVGLLDIPGTLRADQVPVVRVSYEF